MERWIVISNCQTLGLANCLQLQNPDAAVEACDFWSFKSRAEQLSHQLADYDCIFLNDEIIALGLVDFSRFARVVRIPPVVFSGYHPDLCFVTQGSSQVDTPLDAYNSIIALAAFKKGLSEADTLALYNMRTFDSAGYLQLWHSERADLLASFRAYGYEMAHAFRRWTMREGFMYGNNHPRIECLYDLSLTATARAGRTPVDGPFRPHDNLRNGQVFPIYSELAEACGIEGSYLFKPAGHYRLLTLAQFIAGSFDAYRACGTAEFGTGGQFQERYDAVLEAI